MTRRIKKRECIKYLYQLADWKTDLVLTVNKTKTTIIFHMNDEYHTAFAYYYPRTKLLYVNDKYISLEIVNHIDFKDDEVLDNPFAEE